MLANILFSLNDQENGMDKKLKLKKIEIFFLFSIIAVFYIVAGKYFFPHLIHLKYFSDLSSFQWVIL